MTQEVTEEQVNTDSAYMLFYSRKDLQVESFLSDVATAAGSGCGSGCGSEGTESDEDMDKEIKRMCCIQ